MSEYRFCFDPAFTVNKADLFFGEVVQSLEAAKGQLDAIADYTLYLHEMDLMADYSNFSCIQEKIDGEWIVIDEESK